MNLFSVIDHIKFPSSFRGSGGCYGIIRCFKSIWFWAQCDGGEMRLLVLCVLPERRSKIQIRPNLQQLPRLNLHVSDFES